MMWRRGSVVLVFCRRCTICLHLVHQAAYLSANDCCPFSSSRQRDQHLSGSKRGDYQNCSML